MRPPRAPKFTSSVEVATENLSTTVPDPPIDAEYAEVEERPPVLEVDIDWHNMPMLEAQQWYAKLKEEFEHAGSVLNARRCAEAEKAYVCYMAGKPDGCPPGIIRTGRPAGVDSSHKDRLGLWEPVRICSERCWVLYMNEMITERRERELGRERAFMHEPK